MKTLAFVFAATVLEACGDAIVRVALHQQSSPPTRVGLFFLGGVLLTAYGTFLNLAPVEFAAVTGAYVGMLFVVFQIVNYLFFRVPPSIPVIVGGATIIGGGLVVSLWPSN